MRLPGMHTPTPVRDECCHQRCQAALVAGPYPSPCDTLPRGPHGNKCPGAWQRHSRRQCMYCKQALTGAAPTPMTQTYGYNTRPWRAHACPSATGWLSGFLTNRLQRTASPSPSAKYIDAVLAHHRRGTNTTAMSPQAPAWTAAQDAGQGQREAAYLASPIYRSRFRVRPKPHLSSVGIAASRCDSAVAACGASRAMQLRQHTALYWGGVLRAANP